MPKSHSASSVLEPVTENHRDAVASPLHETAEVQVESTPTSAPTASHAPTASKRSEPITVIIPAISEYVLVVRLAVMGVATRMAFAYDQIEDIKLAVTEACNNAILHAAPRTHNAPSGTSSLVTVQMTPYSDRLEVRVFDEGRVPPPGLPAPRNRADVQSASAERESTDALPESGLGLLLIETLMDEVTHHTSAVDRTEVRMTKRLSP